MATRPVKSASVANQNWANAMASPNTQSKYTQGVQAVTQSPNAAAASPSATAKYATATANAVSSGRLAAANNSVSLSTWQQAATAGATALATGAAKGKARQLAAATKLQGAWQAARDAANAIPSDGTLATAAQKVMASMQAMRAAVGKPTS